MTPNSPANIHAITTWTTRKVIVSVLVVLSVIASFLILYYLRAEVVLVFMGIVIGISMAPAVNWLKRHKISRSFSVIAIYILLLTILLIILFIVIPQTLQQVSTSVPLLVKYYENALSTLKSSPYAFLRHLAANLPSSINLIPNAGTSGMQPGSLLSFNWALRIAQTFLSEFFIFSIVLLIGFYWTLEGERVLYNFLLFFPLKRRESVRATITEIENRVGGFLRGQFLLALVIGVAATVAYLLIGLPSFLSLGVLAAIFELVPVFGPALGAIPAGLVAFSISPTKVIWVAVSTTLIQFMENHFLAPRVMQKVVGVNPIITILAMASFGSIFGFIGFLLAIPLSVVFQVLLARSFLRPRAQDIEAPIGRGRVSKLSYNAREFVRDVRKQIRGKEVNIFTAESDDVEDAIESIAVDLDDLLDQTNLVDRSE